MEFGKGVVASSIVNGTVSGDLGVSGATTFTGLVTENGGMTANGTATFNKALSTPVYSNSVASNAVTISGVNGRSQTLALTGATATVRLTFTNFVAGDTLDLLVVQKASAPVNIYWGGGAGVIKWPAGTLPTISTGANAIDRFFFVCVSAGVFVGQAVQANARPSFSKPPVGTLVNAANTICNGMALAWMFNENTGTSVADASGSGNVGTLSGTPLPAWTTGVYGPALSFGTGATSIVTATAAPVTALPVGMFLSVTPASGTTGPYAYFCMAPGGTYVPLIEAYTNAFLVSNGNLLNGAAMATSQFLIAGNCNADGTGLINCNGAQVTGTTGAVNVPNTGFYGGNKQGASQSANGVIDFIYAWNRALTGPEITALLANPFCPFN